MINEERTKTGGLLANKALDDDNGSISEKRALYRRIGSENIETKEDRQPCVQGEGRKEFVINVANKIFVMKKQEDSYWSRNYESKDYLRRAKLEHEKGAKRMPQTNTRNVFVDESCRSCMCAWFHQTVDYFNMAPRTVEVAISCLDRFLASPRGLCFLSTRRKFQVACVTALYISIKVHETVEVHVDTLVKLGRGLCNAQQIYDTEGVMLAELEWKLNPPVATDFAILLVSSLPSTQMTTTTKSFLMDMIYDLIKIYISSYDSCITRRPSAAAAASSMAVLNSLRLKDDRLPYTSYMICSQYLQQLNSCSCYVDNHINELASSLTEAWLQNQRSSSKANYASRKLNNKNACKDQVSERVSSGKSSALPKSYRRVPLTTKPSQRERTLTLFRGTVSPVAVILEN